MIVGCFTFARPKEFHWIDCCGSWLFAGPVTSLMSVAIWAQVASWSQANRFPRRQGYLRSPCRLCANVEGTAVMLCAAGLLAASESMRTRTRACVSHAEAAWAGIVGLERSLQRLRERSSNNRSRSRRPRRFSCSRSSSANTTEKHSNSCSDSRRPCSRESP